ncbi:MAG: MFS transporter [Bacteroidetes bacterium]|nr:MFS transporter [Bacteroidota bacterium]
MHLCMTFLKNITIDITPLRRNRDFRLLFIGQFISFLGSSITTVALSYQIYTITGSTAYVGILGLFQLVPLSISGFIGGSVADRLDRKRIIVIAEVSLLLTSLALAVTAVMDHVPVAALFGIAAVSSFVSGFHRPALDALTPRVIGHDEIPAASALSGFRGTTAMILGPSIAGVILASAGLVFTYLLDALSFAVSILTVLLIRKQFQGERDEEGGFSFSHIADGLRYAWSRKELLGTYFVDMMSMTTTYPYPLFPAIAAGYGSVTVLGSLHASVAVGSFAATLTSGWIRDVQRHGKAITLAATGWCAGILCAGLSGPLWLMLFFFGVAGFADMLSGMFRSIIWNQTIPDAIRGRMVGIEMISYMSGPLLGGTLIGFAAAASDSGTALSAGGAVGIAGILLLVLWLRQFWQYLPASAPTRNGN